MQNMVTTERDSRMIHMVGMERSFGKTARVHSKRQGEMAARRLVCGLRGLRNQCQAVCHLRNTCEGSKVPRYLGLLQGSVRINFLCSFP